MEIEAIALIGQYTAEPMKWSGQLPVVVKRSAAL